MNNKKIFIILSAILLLNITIRYTFVPNELGWDSFFIHGLANQIEENKFISWTQNIYSVFGLYPYSYASGAPILLSIVSLLSGIAIKNVIFIISMLFGIFSSISMYLMTKILFKKEQLSIISALLFSTSLYTRFFTTWTISTRVFFLILVPYIIYLIFKKKDSIKYKVIIIITTFIIAITHHLYIYLILVLITYYINKITIKIHKYYDNTLVKITLIMSFLTLLIAPTLISIYWNNPIFNNNLFFDNITSFFKYYIRMLGILSFLYILGVIVLILKNNKTDEEKFFLILTLISAPSIMIQSYSIAFLTPIICLNACVFIYSFYKSKYNYSVNTKLKYLTLISLLVFHIFISALFQNLILNTSNRNIIHQDYMETSTESAGKWISTSVHNRIISSDRTLINRLNSLETCKYVYENINALSCKYITVDQIKVSSLKPYRTEFWQDSPFLAEYVFVDYLHFITRNFEEDDVRIKEFMKSIDIKYFIGTNKVESQKFILYSSIKERGNKIYDNQKNKIWQDK